MRPKDGAVRFVVANLTAITVLLWTVAAVVWPICLDDVIDNRQISRRGVETEAVVTDPDHRRGSRRSADMVKVRYPDHVGIPRSSGVEVPSGWRPAAGTRVLVRFDPAEPDEARLAAGRPAMRSEVLSTVLAVVLPLTALSEVLGPPLRRARARSAGQTGPPESHTVTVSPATAEGRRLGVDKYRATCACGWSSGVVRLKEAWRLADEHAPEGAELLDETGD